MPSVSFYFAGGDHSRIDLPGKKQMDHQRACELAQAVLGRAASCLWWKEKPVHSRSTAIQSQKICSHANKPWESKQGVWRDLVVNLALCTLVCVLIMCSPTCVMQGEIVQGGDPGPRFSLPVRKKNRRLARNAFIGFLGKLSDLPFWFRMKFRKKFSIYAGSNLDYFQTI